MAIAIGERPPDFDLPATAGGTQALSGGDAEATVVYWTCSHSLYALAWHDRMLDVDRDYTSRGVRFLAIDSNDTISHPADSFEAMAERVEREGDLPRPYLHDESQEVCRAWGAQKTPHEFVLDSACGCATTARPTPTTRSVDAAAYGREALDAVLEGREPERSQTRPSAAASSGGHDAAAPPASRPGPPRDGPKRLVRVPASSANLGPGYDVLAAALAMHLELEVEETGTFSVEAEGLDVPADRSNLCVRAFEWLRPADEIAFRISSDIPLAAGMGSSAAAIVAGLMAADLSRAGPGEFRPAQPRGRDRGARRQRRRRDPRRLRGLLARGRRRHGHPPRSPRGRRGGRRDPLRAGADRAGARGGPRAGGDGRRGRQRRGRLGAGAGHRASDVGLIGRGLADRLHQPNRAHLYPRSMEILEAAAIELGALGATISGAGPTVLVWCFWQSTGKVVEALRRKVGDWAEVQRVPFSAMGADVPEL